MTDFTGSHVLAGFDGSPTSVLALRWAVDEARLRGLPLVVCHAWHWPYPIPEPGSAGRDSLRSMARQVVEEGVAIVRDVAPHTSVHGRLEAGSASAVLVNESESTALVVVGAHGQGGFPGLRVGSSAAQLPAYAHCPVIVVRGTAEPTGPIVVGLDATAASEAALAFGFEEAALRRRPLRAVHGWVPERLDADITSEHTLGRLEQSTALWREKYPYVDAETSLVTRPGREALLQAAEGAGMLVVGGTARDDRTGLGAVAGAMLQLAPCPVAVVPAHATHA